MHGINVGEGGGEASAVATRQPNNIISSPTGTSVDSTNQKLTHPLLPLPLPPLPTDRDGSPTKNNLESRYRRGFFQRGRSQRFARKRLARNFLFLFFSCSLFLFFFFAERKSDGWIQKSAAVSNRVLITYTVTRRELKDD